MPEPDTTPAACGFRHDEWDGPYRMPRRCTAPAGHSDGQFAYDHGPWQCLPLGWVDPPAGGTTPGTSGRTETGAATANAQVTGGEAGDSREDSDLRAGIRKVLGIGSPTVTDHDLIEHIRAALIYRFRADQEVLLKDASLTRVQEIGRRLIAHAKGFQDVLDDTDRGPWTRTVAADLVELEAALTPPADQDRGGQ